MPRYAAGSPVSRRNRLSWRSSNTSSKRRGDWLAGAIEEMRRRADDYEVAIGRERCGRASRTLGDGAPTAATTVLATTGIARADIVTTFHQWNWALTGSISTFLLLLPRDPGSDTTGSSRHRRSQSGESSAGDESHRRIFGMFPTRLPSLVPSKSTSPPPPREGGDNRRRARHHRPVRSPGSSGRSRDGHPRGPDLPTAGYWRNRPRGENGPGPRYWRTGTALDSADPQDLIRETPHDGDDRQPQAEQHNCVEMPGLSR